MDSHDFPQTSTIGRLHRRRISFENFDTARRQDMVTSQESKVIQPNSWHGAKIGVFTSGGDSQGMNAAVRAIVRIGHYLGCKVFYIKEGYQGMVDGGDNIIEATWSSTSNMIHVGGTVIGSARCMDFKERWGILKAATNLIRHGISNLIAIGGDGSLTGANWFRQQWPSLLHELHDKQEISTDALHKYAHLNIVGLVGSIDNDFCGTDMTIGADSALHRIQEAVDNIMTTAVSHKRAFVLEIMGRMCGFLPLISGICSEASTIFIPEDPPPGDWKQWLCDQMIEKMKSGEVRRTHIVLVAEGAINDKGQAIKCEEVKQVLSERMKMDTRVTVLGHVQRGGKTSAFDRLLGSRMGAEAVLALMESDVNTPACVIALDGNEIVRVPMMKSVETTKQVGVKLGERNYDDVVKLRGRSIFQNLLVFVMQRKVTPHPNFSTPGPKGVGKMYRIAMIHVGHPACGMNAAVRGFVGVCVTKGYVPVVIYESWAGLCDNKVKVMTWNDVHDWTAQGGSLLGTYWETAEDVGIQIIDMKLRQHEISGLIIVGGFEAFESAYQLSKHRDTYESLCIPINVIPATIANNVPGCPFSLGCDTAINQICKACDELKQSAFSIQKCVYVIEVGGENCGFLATLAGIASGADCAYIKEEHFTLYDLKSMCERIKDKLSKSGVQYGIVLRNENANPNLTTDFMARLFNEEGAPVFITRSAVLGQVQEGHTATPHDRCSGVKAGSRSAAWVILKMEENGVKMAERVFTKDPKTITIAATKDAKVNFTPVTDLIYETDWTDRLPRTQWWLKLRQLLNILSWPTEASLRDRTSTSSDRDHDHED